MHDQVWQIDMFSSYCFLSLSCLESYVFWQCFKRNFSHHQARCVSVCVWYLCVCRGWKYFKVVSDLLILVADLYGTILVGRPLWTQFDDVVVLAVVSFALLSRSSGFQIFSNLKDIPLI